MVSSYVAGPQSYNFAPAETWLICGREEVPAMMVLACYGVEMVVWDRVFDGIRKHL